MRAKRLPSGRYAWKGKARAFGKLPKAERAAWRSHWSAKAAATRRVVGKAEAGQLLASAAPPKGFTRAELGAFEELPPAQLRKALGLTKGKAPKLAVRRVVATGKAREVWHAVSHRVDTRELSARVGLWDSVRIAGRKLLASVDKADPDKKAISWLVRLEWPDDERSRPGKPFTTVASFPKRTDRVEALRRFQAYVEHAEARGSKFLTGKSGGKGRPRVVELAAVPMKVKGKRKRKRKRKRKETVEE